MTIRISQDGSTDFVRSVKGVKKFVDIAVVLITSEVMSSQPYEPRQANLCLRAFRHDKF